MKKEKTKKRKMTSLEKKEARTGFLFITPYLILFIIFTGIPFAVAVVLAFFNAKGFNQLDKMKFVGFENFIKIFNNSEIMDSLFRTVIYSLIYVPLIMFMGFILAYILNKGVFAKKYIRSTVFLPYVSNMMAVGVIFALLLNLNGPLSGIYKLFGSKFPLLQNPTWALPTVVVIAVWKGVGLNMLTFLGALQNVNTELLEAAQMDGATRWQQIKNVVIPSISPTTFFLLISSIITSLQNYTVIQSLTQGKSNTSTMAISIVDYAFSRGQTSMASAQALIIFAIVMVITLFQWRGQKKWVNY